MQFAVDFAPVCLCFHGVWQVRVGSACHGLHVTRFKSESESSFEAANLNLWPKREPQEQAFSGYCTKVPKTHESNDRNP